MKCIDASLKSLIVFLHSDTVKSQNDIQKVQGSFALACLMRNIYGQDHTAIPKQLQQLQDRAKQYSTTVDMPKFKREFQSETAIYNKMVQLFGRRQDIERKKSEIEICEILLSEVYSQDRELAKTLKRRLEAKPPLTLEELLTTRPGSTAANTQHAANPTTRFQRSTRFVFSAEHDDATIFWRISLSLATAEHAKSDAKCTQYLQFWTILSTHRPTIYV